MAEYIVESNESGSIPFTSNGVRTKEEIIRCRDCKMSKGEDDDLGICPFYVGNPNGFCSWAERSE